jgi:hypothetical protein
MAGRTASATWTGDLASGMEELVAVGENGWTGVTTADDDA